MGIEDKAHIRALLPICPDRPFLHGSLLHVLALLNNLSRGRQSASLEMGLSSTFTTSSSGSTSAPTASECSFGTHSLLYLLPISEKLEGKIAVVQVFYKSFQKNFVCQLSRLT
jgi:hypothetical protein